MSEVARNGGDGAEGGSLEEVEEYLRSLAADQEEQAARQAILASICAVNDRLLACTYGAFANRAQEWCLGETHDQWIARLNVQVYAERFVAEAMLPAASEIRRAEADLGFSFESLLRMEIPRHFAQRLRRRGQLVTVMLLRLYANPEDKDVAAGVTEGLTRLLTKEREAVEAYHWWFEGLAGKVRELHSRVLGLPRPDRELIREEAMRLWAAPTHPPVVPVAPPGPESPSVTRSGAGQEPPPNVFVRDGNVWGVVFESEEKSIPHRVGMFYVQVLLRNQLRQVGVDELALAAGIGKGSRPNPETGSRGAHSKPHEEALADLASQHAATQPKLDDAARKSYQARIRMIDEEMAEARSLGDEGREMSLQGEKEKIRVELEANRKRGRRSPGFTSDQERLRHRIGNALTEAIKAIRVQHPRLAEHLRTSIKGRRGYAPCYTPQEVTAWSF